MEFLQLFRFFSIFKTTQNFFDIIILAINCFGVSLRPFKLAKQSSENIVVPIF